MLVNQGKNLLFQPDLVSSEPTVSDPWQTPIPVPKTNTVTESWHFSTETNPLISPAASAEAPRLASHQSTSEEILLGDELKLKTTASRKIKQQLEQALTLLYWLKTIGQANSSWQMS